MASPAHYVERVNINPGDTVAGKYQVKSILGEGSFGTVYLVSAPDSSRYALKLLRLWDVDPSIRRQLCERFDMEFETGRIDSPYLVHTVDHGLLGGNPFIVMEYCPGGDLIALSSKTTLDHSRIALDVLAGLKALHSCGKVHRDLKPENVLCRADGTFALTDFGIAGDRNKRMTERTILGRPKQIFGTYAYMPPEQVKPVGDATVLPTTDIFSFGVMMYQLLSGGRLPFGKLDSHSDLLPYIDAGRNGRWDRQIIFGKPQGDKWVALLEACLNPNFKNRLNDAAAAIQLVPANASTARHPSVCDTQPTPGFSCQVINGLLLRVMQGEEYGKVYRLDDLLSGDRAILTMGRRDYGVTNDISIMETMTSYISRRHCTFELDYNIGQWVVRDGQWAMLTGGHGWHPSTNGTFVNSVEVPSTGMPLAPGDIISLGEVTLRAEGY